MHTTIVGGSKPIFVWDKEVAVAEAVIEQMRVVTTLPFVYKHIAVMPDSHCDTGTAAASVLATQKAIIPAAVGTDIGCGILACQTNLTAKILPDNLKQLQRELEQIIPRGTKAAAGKIAEWGEEPPKAVVETWIANFAEPYNNIVTKHPIAHSTKTKPYQQLGTLGSANHFVQLCLDEEDIIWVILYAGSRAVGDNIGKYFIKLAKEFAEKHLIHNYLPTTDLAYFAEGTELFNDYMEAMVFAQSYAVCNRMHIMNNVFNVLQQKFENMEQTDITIDCHHNYAANETHYGKAVWVSRKGTVNIQKGTYGVILGPTGTSSYIVEGTDNRESFNSFSHGANMAMPTNGNWKSITTGKYKKDHNDDLESAADIEAIIASQENLITVKTKLKPILTIRS